MNDNFKVQSHYINRRIEIQDAVRDKDTKNGDRTRALNILDRDAREIIVDSLEENAFKRLKKKEEKLMDKEEFFKIKEEKNNL